MKPVVPLFNVRGSDIVLCGAKGAQLGELMSVGLPVPGGFVVTTDAYKEHMEKTELGEEIQEILEHVDRKNLHDLSNIAASIQSMVQQTSIDSELASEIKSHFKEIGVDYVAVRSSPAVADDPLIYYEGNLATSLNVKKDNLITNVEHCWASLYYTRSLECMFRNNMLGKEVLVAVVVQEMVDAEVSGIAYTIDVKKKDTGKVMIEAGWGLGEAMVSGIVSPDRYTVDKEKFEVVECTVGKQFKEVVREEQRHRIVDVPAKKRESRKLEDEQVLQIARLCIHVEEYYGVPQQLEWAWVDEKFSILQTKALSK